MSSMLHFRTKYLCLIGVYMIYSCTALFSKMASTCEFLSIGYLLYLCGSVAVLGIYAILWQQIIKRIPLADAYIFKGTGVIWSLLICYFFFGEPITFHNILGSILIIAGVTFYARS